MMKVKVWIIACLSALSLNSFAQEDLLDLLDDPKEEEKTTYTTATFKGTRIVNMQSPEIPAKGVMQFVFMHRFGAFSDDFFYNFLGLDQAVVRISFDYSPTDRLNFAVSRNSEAKVYDAFIKYKILRQSTGKVNMPISMLFYSSFNMSALRWTDNLPHNFSDRLSYVHQLIIARKFSESFSFQVVPTVVHFNFVDRIAQPNDIFAVGFGGRYKLNQRLALTSEYMLQLPKNTFVNQDGNLEPYNNALSVGLDIETGGHVFQLHLTNSRSLADPYWMTRTPGSWTKGDIYFGFNVSRVFTLKKPKKVEAPSF